MNKKMELIQNLAELGACLIDIEEIELKEVERSITDIRRICNAGHAILDEVYDQLDLK